MLDRVPTPGRENRVKITQDDGTVVAGVLEYDDQATQEGSAYNVANVLPSNVLEALGLDSSAEPKDAFLALRTFAENYTDSQLHKRLETTFQKLMTGRLV